MNQNQSLNLNLYAATVRLVGASDWNSPEITVYMKNADDISAILNSQHILDAVCSHLATLCRHVFLTRKPPKPTQSRWTGVAGVARWGLCLACFHRSLAPVLSALVKTEKGEGPGQNNMELDNDAGLPSTAQRSVSLNVS